MHQKEREQAIRAELSRYPEIEFAFSRLRRHPVVTLRCGDRQRRVVFNGTKLNNRALLNIIADVRRAAREVTGQ